MKKKCENRFCGKEIDTEDCYSYTAYNGQKTFWCNDNCYREHIGEVKPKEICS